MTTPDNELSIPLRKVALRRALYACWELMDERAKNALKQDYPEDALVCIVNHERYVKYLIEET